MEKQEFNGSNLKVKIYTVILAITFAVLFMSMATVLVTGAEGEASGNTIVTNTDDTANTNNTANTKTASVDVSDSDIDPDSFYIYDGDGSNFVKSAVPSDDFEAVTSDGASIGLSGVTVGVSELGDNEKKDVLSALNKVAPNVKNYVMYDITLLDPEYEELSISKGSLTVKLSYPSSLKNPEKYNFVVYHYKGNGSIEKISNVKVDASGVSFAAKSFSPYVLTWSLKSSTGSDSPATGDEITTTVAASYIAIISLFAIAIVSIKLKIAKGRLNSFVR